MKISGPQAHRIYQSTIGYRRDSLHELVVYHDKVHLTVYNVVYVIDRAGGYQMLRESDGAVIGNGPALREVE